MSSSRLFRVQRELQTHRAWLQSFRHSISAVASPAQCPLQRAQFHTTSSLYRLEGPSSIYRPRLRKKVTSKPKPPGSVAAKFLAALDDADYRNAVDCYNALGPAEKQDLYSSQLTQLIRLISGQALGQLRLVPDQRDRDVVDHIEAAAQTLAQDIQKNLLPNARHAYPGLIAFLTQTKQFDAANRLWKWLRAQEDNELASKEVYAAAIELLAAQDMSLPNLEALYQEALRRFPEHFAAYHLSPGAVVPDRETAQPRMANARVLLRSIMLARVQRGDSKNAYLALDTHLRLDPILLSKGFESFLKDRPISEAWTTFMMACRGGIKFPHRDLRTLMISLKPRVDTSSSEHAVWALRAIMTATYVFVGSGGVLTRNVANEILINTTQLMRLPGVEALSNEDRQQLAQAVQDVLRKMIALFSRFNATPSVPVFNSIITNVAGFGGLKPVLSTAWNDMESTGQEPNMVTYRSVLTAAGMLKDVDLIKTSWVSLVEARAAQNEYPDATEMHILTKACILAGQPELVTATLAEMTHLTEEEKERVHQRLDEGIPEFPSATIPLDFKDNFVRHIETLKQDLVQFEIATEDYPHLADLSTRYASLPMFIVPPPADVQLPETEMRKLYDEMTTDPTSQPPDASAPPTFSRTNISYGTLRYENWKTLNSLLSLAERNDRLYDEAVDEAIAAGKSPPGRLEVGAVVGDVENVKIGLSELAEGGGGVVEEEISGEEVERRRARIIALRTPASA